MLKKPEKIRYSCKCLPIYWLGCLEAWKIVRRHIGTCIKQNEFKDICNKCVKWLLQDKCDCGNSQGSEYKTFWPAQDLSHKKTAEACTVKIDCTSSPAPCLHFCVFTWGSSPHGAQVLLPSISDLAFKDSVYYQHLYLKYQNVHEKFGWTV